MYVSAGSDSIYIISCKVIWPIGERYWLYNSHYSIEFKIWGFFSLFGYYKSARPRRAGFLSLHSSQICNGPANAPIRDTYQIK